MAPATPARRPSPYADGGARMEWSDVPGPVRAGVEHLLSSPVVAAVNQPGGFSPGPAARVRCADGSRAFVKAAGTALNPDSPGMHRNEARIAAQLPRSVPTPRLLGVFDDGDWVALVYEEIDGRMPSLPWRTGELRRVLAAVTALARSLTPCPVDTAPGLADRLAEKFAGYQRLAADPPGDLSGWERRNLDRLADAGTGVLAHLTGDTLVHCDLRADNLLLGADGQVYVVDWPWASRGPAWVDTALFLVDVALSGLDPQPYLDGHPLFDDVDPTAVTGLLAGFAGMLAENCRRPAPPGLPTLRDFQRSANRAILRWVRQRAGWA